METQRRYYPLYMIFCKTSIGILVIGYPHFKEDEISLKKIEIWLIEKLKVKL